MVQEIQIISVGITNLKTCSNAWIFYLQLRMCADTGNGSRVIILSTHFHWESWPWWKCGLEVNCLAGFLSSNILTMSGYKHADPMIFLDKSLAAFIQITASVRLQRFEHCRRSDMLAGFLWVCLLSVWKTKTGRSNHVYMQQFGQKQWKESVGTLIQ